MGSPKSQNIHDKRKLEERLRQCPEEICQIFHDLRTRAIEECKTEDWGYSDKPDLRIGFVYNMIEFVPKPSHVVVMLRVDNQSPDELANRLATISITEARDARKPGYRQPDSRWVEFQVSEANQISESLQLIKHVYNRRQESGW